MVHVENINFLNNVINNLVLLTLSIHSISDGDENLKNHVEYCLDE